MGIYPITHCILDTILLFTYFLHLLLCGRTLTKLPLYQKLNFAVALVTFTLVSVLVSFTWARRDEKGLPGLTSF
jgi:membrane protein implicated in regulation of membrane protease activity